MSTTFVQSLLNFLGLNLMANDVHRLERAGVSPLSFLVLFCACEMPSPCTVLLLTVICVLVFYTVRVHIIYVLAARTALVAGNTYLFEGWTACYSAFESLQEENATLLNGWRACSEHYKEVLAAANSAVESLERENTIFHQGWSACFENYQKLLAAANSAVESLQREKTTLLDGWRACSEHYKKALAGVNFTLDCLKRELAALRDTNGNLDALIAKLQHENKVAAAALAKVEDAHTKVKSELAESRAGEQKWKRQAEQLAEDADAREVAHQAECTGNMLRSELDQTKITKLEDTVRVFEAQNARLKTEALTARQSTRHADATEQAMIPDSRDAKDVAEKAHVSIGNLEDAVKAEPELSQSLDAHVDKPEATAQRSEARLEGLATDTTSLELRDDVPSLERTVTQIYAGADDMVVSYEAAVEVYETTLTGHVEENEYRNVHESVALRTCEEGIKTLGQAATSPWSSPSSPASLVDSCEDLDTPSLTFSDLDAAILDDSPIENHVYLPSTPARIHQSTEHYALTTSTSAEFISYNTGAALLIVRALGHLRNVFAWHLSRYFGTHASFIV
ncbi:hypothetical protein PENSPDRAFT_757719 [Peniophora sp. CONT]|nr:hypothetical protein PENSPDRAFT_757719 [Peniophora sp. CONT]